MPDKVTVGVSVAIPRPHADVLTGWRRRVGDPAADLVWPHVTLLPPMPATRQQLPEIERHLAGVAADSEPFGMHLSGTGTFRPLSPVVYVQVARGVADCEVLEKAVRSGPLDRELEFIYHPHVTVAQDVSEEALDAAYEGLADFVARFRVESLGLYFRDRTGKWTHHREFALGVGVPVGGTGLR